MYARDDYKRCVCEYWGKGEESCPQVTGSGGNSGDGSGDGSGDDGSSGDNSGGDGNSGGDSSGGDGNSGGDSSGGDGSSGDDGSSGGGSNAGDILADLLAGLADVKNHRDYSQDEKSRTTYQVDASLDYIEKKFIEFHSILMSEGLIKAE